MGIREQRAPRVPALDTSDPHGIGFLLTKYREWQEIKGFSTCTIYTQGRNLAHFCLWAADRGLKRPGEITKPILERYQRCLFQHRKSNGLPLSFRSQGTHLSGFQLYTRFEYSS